MFSFEDVSYGPLRHVHAHIMPGITAIAGTSGSGKTTLFNLMTKLVRPDGGSVSFEGRSLATWDAVQLRRTVVTVPQESFIWPGSVRDNLYLTFRFHCLPLPAEAVLEEVLELVGLGKPLDAECVSFSGGERARLSLARSLVVGPSWVLWDEPTAALDGVAAQQLFTRVQRVFRERDRNLVFITHNPDLFAAASHRLLVEGGQVAQA